MRPLPEQIEAAAKRIAPHVRRTPVIEIPAGEISCVPVTFKLEFLQRSGSFKARGAFNTLLSALERAPETAKSGVIAASGGNHGIAVATAAQALGMRAEIFVPTISAPAKVNRLKSLGAMVYQQGDVYADALNAARARQAETGALDIHAYDQKEVLAGQGTMARETEQQVRDATSLFFAVGGGGFIGGALCWLQNRKKIIAVEPETSCALNAALAEGTPCDVEVTGLAADSLGARRIGKLCFEAATDHLDESLLVSDADIRQAQLWLWDHLRIATEPGGATALAPLLSGRYQPQADERPVVVLCGANVDPASMNR